MRREIKEVEHLKKNCGCCPGHDLWPNEKYKSARSRRARAKGKAAEHRYARRILNRRVKEEIL